MTSVSIDSGDSYLDRNEDLFLTKIDLSAARQWHAYNRYSLTDVGCAIEIDGNRYWLTMDVSAGSGGYARFKEINPALLSSKPAQQRCIERAERMLPDRIFRAKEKLIFNRIMDLPLEERQKVKIDCDLVRYDGDDKRYRAHACDRDRNEVHVTEFGSFSGVQRMLREWAVANDLCYCGGYVRHDSPESFSQFLRAIHKRKTENPVAS
jgi:hypothetical protein